MRVINQAGLALLKSFEQCRLEAYQDDAGVWTIGWGHTVGVVAGMVCTQDQADQWLVDDLAAKTSNVDVETRDVATSDNQFSAMSVFAFNIGSNGFATSSVLAFHRLGQFDRAAAAFGLWNKDRINGVLVVSAGLTRRRQAESDLYSTPDLPSTPSAGS